MRDSSISAIFGQGAQIGAYGGGPIQVLWDKLLGQTELARASTEDRPAGDLIGFGPTSGRARRSRIQKTGEQKTKTATECTGQDFLIAVLPALNLRFRLPDLLVFLS